MRRKQKGFTLVELLVVIVILGIITGISIPLIRNIQARNEMRKYTTYMDSLKVSAKLYVNSYEEDLFGHEKSGCAIIYYSQMEEKNLLKDITVSGVSCNTKKTLVKVVKVDDKIGYSTMIGCGEPDSSGKIKVDTELPEGGLVGIDTCGIDTKTIMGFEAIPSSSSSINYKKRNITVKATSNTGFLEDYDISYAYVKKSNKPSNIMQEPTVVNNEWKKLNLNYIGGNEQKKEIEKGNAIILDTPKFQTPENVTGEYYLVLRIDNLRNLGGRNWTTDLEQSKYYYFGSYILDNTKPVFTNDSTVVSSNANYNDIKPKLKINVTDVYSTSGTYKELRMCTSYDSDTCSKKIDDIKKKKNGWITYDKDKVLDKIQDAYDGSTHKIYVVVGDAAGNYETKSYDYKIATRYTLTYNSNGGKNCSPTTKSVTFDNTAPAWGTLCSPTRDNYTFTGWNTREDGTGTTITKDTIATGNITVYAQWRKNKVIFQYKVLSGETLTPSTTADNGTVYTWTKDSSGLVYKDGSLYTQKFDFDSTSIDLANHNNAKYLEIKKPSYHGKSGEEWICDSGCKTAKQKFSQASTNITLSDICDYKVADCTVTVKVNWSPTEYTITYNLNGGSVATANPTKYTIESADITLNNPSKTGYNFTGWTGSNGTTKQETVTISQGTTGDKTYTANYTPITYTITYTLNSGALPSGKTNPDTYTIESNTITLEAPEKNCYSFTGWTGSNGSTKQKTVKITKGSTGNKTYTANWDEVSYSITYDLDSGSLPTGKSNPSSYTVSTATFSLETPERSHRVFAGWTGTGLTSATTSVSIAEGSCENKSYTATWNLDTHTITYDGNGNTGGSTSSTTCTCDTDCTLATNGFTKTNYDFDGWYTAESGGTKYGTTTKIKANTTVHAHWKASFVPGTSFTPIPLGVNSEGKTVNDEYWPSSFENAKCPNPYYKRANTCEGAWGDASKYQSGTELITCSEATFHKCTDGTVYYTDCSKNNRTDAADNPRFRLYKCKVN